MLRLIRLVPLCLLACAGCWAPTSGVKQGTFEAGTNWLGQPYFRTSSDASGEVINLSKDKATGVFKADRITFSANPSVTNPTVVPIIGAETAYGGMQWAGNTAYLHEMNQSPIVQGLGQAIPMLPGLLGQYVQARATTSVAKTQARGQIIREFAGLAATWKAGTGTINPQQIIDQDLLPRDIVKEAMAKFPNAFAAPPVEAVTPAAKANTPATTKESDE